MPGFSSFRGLKCIISLCLAIEFAFATPHENPQPETDELPASALAHLGDVRFRHGAAAVSVVFSADSKRVLSCGQDGALRVWNAASGAPLHNVTIPQNPVSMTRGESTIAIAFSDDFLRVFNSNTSREIATFSPVLDTDFALSQDGTMLAMHDTNGIVVTELDSELPKLELPAGGPLAFHPDGQSIAVADPDGKVTFYKLIGGKPILMFDHGQKLNGLAISPDGKRAVTGSRSGGDILKVWDIGSAKLVAEIKGVGEPRMWIGTSQIAAANESGAGVYDFSMKRWLGFVEGIGKQWAISPDGTKLATAGKGEFHIKVWDLKTGKQVLTDSQSFPDAVLLAPARDGKRVFILSKSDAFLWPLAETNAIFVGKLPAKALAASTMGEKLAVAVPDGVLIYDRFDPGKTLADKPTRTLTAFAAGCKAIALSPDGKKIAYSGESARLVIANTADGSTERVLSNKTLSLCLAFTPDSENLAVIGRDGFLRLCRVRAPAAGEKDYLWATRVQRNQMAAVAISPDGKVIAASSSTQLLFIAAADGTVLHAVSRQHYEDGPFQKLAFSNDGRFLISGSGGMNGTLQIWDVASRSLLRRDLTYFGAIQSLAFFPDGSRFVSAGAEEAITLWDLSLSKGIEKR